jgi:phosphopantothenoylcysteine decarboxylase
MANLLLGVTGSVAAIRVPDLYAALRQEAFDVKIVATKAATYFFDPSAIDPSGNEPLLRNRDVVILDEDEWPDKRYRRGDEVLHIELRRWADLLLVAPLDANTLAKFAVGLSDNCLTCVWRAWDRNKPVILAPAMNTLMWEHPLTARQLAQIAADAGINLTLQPDPALICAAINERSSSLRIVAPQVKQLACGDTGVGAMADVAGIVAAARQLI